MTYYTSLSYTNYTLVTDWYVAGNEIADHTYVLLPYSFLWVSRPPRQAAVSRGSRSGVIRTIAATPETRSHARPPNSWLRDILE